MPPIYLVPVIYTKILVGKDGLLRLEQIENIVGNKPEYNGESLLSPAAREYMSSSLEWRFIKEY